MKAGWQTKKLGDAATLQRGFDLPTQDRVSGAVPLVSSSGIIDTHHKSAVRGPGVVTGRSGSIGNIFFIEEDFWPLNTTLYVKDFHGNDPRFVFYLLKHFDLNRFASGSGVPTLNRNFVHDELVNVPIFSEQQRIVGILDEAFDGIATAKGNAEKNFQNARALFESHLQAVFTQRGEGWVERTLADICIKITDGEHLRPKVTSSGVPFLSAKDVLDHDVVFTDPLFVAEADALKFRRRCDPEMGDILIVSRGATVGRTCIVKTRSVFCLLGSVILLKVAAILSAHFIAYALKSPSIRRQLMTASEASAQQAIYLRDIKSLNIGCPSITEQHAIVCKLDALSAETQRLESIYKQKLAALDALKKSLLDQAFTGVL